MTAVGLSGCWLQSVCIVVTLGIGARVARAASVPPPNIFFYLRIGFLATGLNRGKKRGVWAVAYRGGVWGLTPPPEIPTF
jgi:hypothetical protein